VQEEKLRQRRVPGGETAGDRSGPDCADKPRCRLTTEYVGTDSEFILVGAGSKAKQVRDGDPLFELDPTGWGAQRADVRQKEFGLIVDAAELVRDSGTIRR
jgi:hypothetical protein